MARRKYGQRPRPPHLPSEGGFITFRDGTLVNDDAINSYIDVLKMFARPTIHVFNTFFFSRLLDGFDKVATWHKDLRHPVFTHMERIIVPIHLKSQSHWATVSIDFKRRIVTYMDSIFLPSTFEFVTEIMRKYLADLAALETCSFDLEAWTFIGSKDTVRQVFRCWFFSDYDSLVSTADRNCGLWCFFNCKHPQLHWDSALEGSSPN